jgi:thiamine biosynthesis lipoprotein
MSHLHTFTWHALGTCCSLQLAGVDAARARRAAAAVRAWVESFEARYSRFRAGSLISDINRRCGQWVAVDAGMEAMLNLCDSLYFITRGALDPTAEPLVRLWYGVDRPPAAAAVAAARALVHWPAVQRRPGAVRLPSPGMALDFGGFKEYAVDQAAAILRQHGVQAFLVDFGKDLCAGAAPPDAPAWHIGLEHPDAPGKVNGSIALVAAGMAASGDYHRCFIHAGVRYGHIIDPRTGYPVANGCRVAHVIGGSCLEAGVHATAAFILGVPAGVDLIEGTFGMSGCLVADNGIFTTSGFSAHLCAVPRACAGSG